MTSTNRALRCLVTGTMLLIAIASTPGVDLEARFRLSNLEFDRDRVLTDRSLPGDRLDWGVSALVRQPLSDQLSVAFEYDTDQVLRNTVYARLSYVDSFFSVAVGPFFGILNGGGSFLKSGLSTTVTLFAPGIAIATLRSDTSLSGRLVVPGDYIQEQSELSLGFYVPNAIPTFYVRSRRFSYRAADGGENVDRLVAYGLETRMFQKNTPYRITIDFAYQSGARVFGDPATGTQIEHGFGALAVGTAVSADLFDRWSAHVDLQSAIFLFGTGELLGASRGDAFLFRLTTGVAFSL